MAKIKILLIEPNQNVGEVISKSLQRAFDADVIFHQDVELGLDLLRNNESFALIIGRNKHQTDDMAIIPISEKILNCLYDLSLNTPVIVIGEFDHTLKNFFVVSEKLRIEEINRLVIKALELKKSDFEHLKLADYTSFPIKDLYLMITAPTDIFIKLTKKTGDDYVRRIKEGDEFNVENLKSYEELGLQYFYIDKDQYENFINGLFDQCNKKIKESTSTDECFHLVGEVFTLGVHLSRTLGIDKKCVTMIDQTIENLKNQIQKKDSFGVLLKRLLDNKLSYSYRNSYLISVLSYKLLPKMEWGAGNQIENHFSKILFVSFFHDICIEDENLLKISNRNELKKAGLGSKELDICNNHAHRAALMVLGHPKLPQGVDTIIKQHHGTTNGVGYAEFLTAGISPMAIFFMVVEEFSKKVLEIPESSKMPDELLKIIEPLKQRFQLPSYRKVITEIEKLISFPR